MSRRVPNLLHTFLFLALTIFCFLLVEAVLLVTSSSRMVATLSNQRLQVPAEAAAYLLTLAIAPFAFAALWDRPFLRGIAWNASAVRPLFGIAGIITGFLAQAATTLIPVHKDVPIEGIFRNPALIWFLAFLGVVVAPVFEEIVFRGFLLPALALAVDWLRLPRGAHLAPDEALAALDQWRASESFSRPALVIASIVTSVLFALIHAPQLGYTWAAIALLACVSLLLCYVRLRTHSVAASALFHACYNLSVFLTLYVATGGFRHLDRM